MIHPRHPSTGESCYMTSQGYIYYSLSFWTETHTHLSIPQMLSQSLWLKISSFAVLELLYMSSVLQHRSCIILFSTKERQFQGPIPQNHLTSSLSKNYGRYDLSPDRQVDHTLWKPQEIQQFMFLVLESFINLSPELASSWRESKNPNLSSG